MNESESATKLMGHAGFQSEAIGTYFLVTLFEVFERCFFLRKRTTAIDLGAKFPIAAIRALCSIPQIAALSRHSLHGTPTSALSGGLNWSTQHFNL
jgi:hypothetical protein